MHRFAAVLPIGPAASRILCELTPRNGNALETAFTRPNHFARLVSRCPVRRTKVRCSSGRRSRSAARLANLSAASLPAIRSTVNGSPQSRARPQGPERGQCDGIQATRQVSPCRTAAKGPQARARRLVPARAHAKSLRAPSKTERQSTQSLQKGVSAKRALQQGPPLNSLYANRPPRRATASGGNELALLVINCQAPTLPGTKAKEVGSRIDSGPVGESQCMARFLGGPHHPLKGRLTRGRANQSRRRPRVYRAVSSAEREPLRSWLWTSTSQSRGAQR